MSCTLLNYSARVFMAGLLLLSQACGPRANNAPGSMVAQKEDEENPAGELQDVLNDLNRQFTDTFTIDTVLLKGADSIHVTFLHFANRDTMMALPSRYCEPWGLQGYAYPALFSQLQIAANGAKMLDTLWDRSVFAEVLPREWKEDIAMLYPVLKFGDSSFIVTYNLSVPLTDLGRLASIEVRYSGGMQPPTLNEQ